MISYGLDSSSGDLRTVATYSCNEGFQLIGDESRICIDRGDGNGGVFDGEASFCECKLIWIEVIITKKS